MYPVILLVQPSGYFRIQLTSMIYLYVRGRDHDIYAGRRNTVLGEGNTQLALRLIPFHIFHNYWHFLLDSIQGH